MRRPAFFGLWLLTWLLAACGASPPLPSFPVGERKTAAPTRAPGPSVFAQSSDGTAVLTRAPSPAPSPTPTPTPTPTLTQTPTPSPPALLAPSTGQPLPLSIQPLLNVDGHLTAGVPTLVSGEERFVLAALDRYVYSVSSAGQVRWKARSPGPVYALTVLADGRVAAGDETGSVVLLDAAGQRVWLHTLESRVTAVQGLWQGGLLVGGWDEKLTLLAVDGADERVRWQAELGSPVTDIASLPQLALVSTMDGFVHAFDPSGARVWLYDAGAPVVTLSTDAALAAGSQAGAVILAGCQDGRLVALRPDGTLRWQLAVGTGSPVWAVADMGRSVGAAIVVGMGGAASELALLTREGQWLWRTAVSSPVSAVATADLDGDGEAEILVGLADGEVVAYDAAGRRRASVQVGLPVWHLGVSAPPGGEAGLALAGVSAWRIVQGNGPAGKARFVPPVMLPSPSGLPAPERSATSGSAPAQEAVLAFVGDVVLGRSIELQMLRQGAGYPWIGLAPLLSRADLAVANLEGVLTTHGQPMAKRYVIRAHPYWARSLAEAGFDLMALANNHALDFGDRGLDETLGSLQELEIAAVGAGGTQAQARRPALSDLNGVRVALLAYAGAYWKGSADMPVSDRIAWADPEAVRADIQAVRGQADVVIVMLHEGKEYARTPSSGQVEVAHAAIDAGADLVVGHHPHVTQTVERYHGGLIVYSLGNALFDIPIQAAMQGDLLLVRVTNAGVARAELWPFWIDAEVQPRLLDDGAGGARYEVIYP